MPDAGCGGVPDAVAFGDLFAAWLVAFVCGVEDAYDEFVGAGGDGVCDVIGEPVVAASVDFFTVESFQDFSVEGDAGLPVYGIEVEKESVVIPVFGECKVAAVGYVGGAFADAGEGGFDGEGDEDLAVEVWIIGEGLFIEGDVPEAV